MLLFLPAALGLYFLVPGVRAKNGVLLAASLLFYAWGEPLWVFALIALTGAVWLCSLGAARLGGAAARLCTAAGVVLPLAVLAHVKYGAFLLRPLLSPLGLAVGDVRMPLGISFFTFQIITYAVDVYRDPRLFQPRPLRLLLYVACFPQLVAGPIVRYGDVAAALEDRRVSLSDFIAGMERFACGLGKKVLLANTCGRVVRDALACQAADPSAAGGWTFALLYSLQIYFDFSGYSDMAIGLGRVFGFRYEENFLYPYASDSVAGFWRRWHRSLGAFFREYVYIPLGGNRCGRGRQLLNLLIVWSLTGLWHGASLNFVLWGLYFFALLAAERFFPLRPLSALPRPVRTAGTYILVLAGWIVFYFTDLGEMGRMLASLAGIGAAGRLPLSAPGLAALWRRYSAFPVLALAGAFPPAGRILRRIPEAPAALWWTGIYFLSLLFIVGQSYNPFIYFRF